MTSRQDMSEVETFALTDKEGQDWNLAKLVFFFTSPTFFCFSSLLCGTAFIDFSSQTPRHDTNRLCNIERNCVLFSATLTPTLYFGVVLLLISLLLIIIPVSAIFFYFEGRVGCFCRLCFCISQRFSGTGGHV